MRSKDIKSWTPELRPREKMLESGAASMRNAELMGGDLLALSKLDIKSLCRFSGMGIAKASSVMAAMELGKRMYPMLNVKSVKKLRITSGVYIQASPG